MNVRLFAATSIEFLYWYFLFQVMKKVLFFGYSVREGVITPDNHYVSTVITSLQ